MRTSRRWIKNVDAGIVVVVVMLVASLSGVLGTARGAVHGAVLATVGGLSATTATATATADADADATERRPRLYLYPPAPRLLPTAEQASSAPTPALERIVAGMRAGFVDQTGLDGLAATHDPRQAWFVADLLRFYQGTDSESGLVVAFRKLTGVDPSGDPMFADSAWLSVTNHLFAWALPAPANYREFKGRMFTLVEPKWKPFFADAHSEIDWRYVSWGGVQLDDRPLGTTTACAGGCIPALDDPAMTSAKAGSWYPDSATVFGIVEGSEAVAFPKNIMEVHEMVNTTIGGRRMAIPYCTLCGSAQAYFIDHVRGANQPLVLRTSGLLTRSNKVMFELNTRSVFDTFTGRAVSGSLHDNKVSLVETSVTTSTWALAPK